MDRVLSRSAAPTAAAALLSARHRTATSVRAFGRQRKPNIFGHATRLTERPATWRQKLLGVGLATGCAAPFVNWDHLAREYGLVVPFFTEFYATQAIDGTTNFALARPEEVAINPPDAAREALAERREDVDRFVVRRAERADARAEADPEAREQRDGKFVRLMRRKMAPAEVKAEERRIESEDDEDDESGEEEEEQGVKAKKVGFRSKKIMGYENRIRQFSTPDKIFRYFATYRVLSPVSQHTEVMMTPEDFLRSITPDMLQPEQLGLDQFRTAQADELAKISTDLGVEQDSVFHRFGAGGLISFSDYIFLLTVLSTSKRHFEIAFKMFDLNGDGRVDAKEFEVVTDLMRSQSSAGARHRDHQNTGSTFKGLNSGLANYFFGADRRGTLTVDKFLEFQKMLQNEILALEFKRKCAPGRDRISEKDFAELLIAYAGFNRQKRAKMLKRVRREFGKREDAPGISLQDYLHFHQVLNSINDVDTALTFHHLAGAPIERTTMLHTARTVAGVDLRAHLVDVVFVLFDGDGDGKLSNREFVGVMKQRALRGLEKPKDTGVGRVLGAVLKCAGEARPAAIGGFRKTE